MAINHPPAHCPLKKSEALDFRVSLFPSHGDTYAIRSYNSVIYYVPHLFLIEDAVRLFVLVAVVRV